MTDAFPPSPPPPRPPTPPAPPAPSASPVAGGPAGAGAAGPTAREAAVAAATTAWIDQLIDLGANNRLLYYRDLKVGTIDLDAFGAPPTTLDQFRTGRKTRLSALVTDHDARLQAARKVRAIAAKAQENFEERGIQTLFLAWGMATWTGPSTITATPAAPVLLLPLSIVRRDPAGEDFELDLDGDAEVNPTLVHALAAQHGVSVDADALLAALDGEGGVLAHIGELFGSLQAMCAAIPGFAVTDRCVIGNFSFAKLPMVRDLERYAAQLATHDVIAAIAGDPGAQASVRTNRPELPADLPDRTAPGDEFLVLPADASQNLVINRVLAGEHVMVQGPPGTGKSQTIANLIAALVARGQRVLFVAEKRAAIDAVVNRVDGAGLADVVLDLHRDTVSRAKVAATLAESLRRVRESTAPDQARLHENLVRTRQALVDHEQAMNAPRAPWGKSLSAVQAELLALPTAARSTLRFGPGAIERMDAATLDQLGDLLRDHVALIAAAGTADATEAASGTGAPSGWEHATLSTTEEAQRALAWAEYLNQAAAAVPAHLAVITSETGLTDPGTPSGWQARFALLHGVQDVLLRFHPAVFSPSTDLDRLVTQLAPAAQGAGFMKNVFSGDLRAAKKQAAALCRSDPGDDFATVHAGLVAAAAARTTWAGLRTDGGDPRVPPSLLSAEQAFTALIEGRAALAAFLPEAAGIDAWPFASIVTWASALVADQAALFRIPRRREIEAAFAAVGATPVLELAIVSGFDGDAAVAAFRYAWLASIKDAVSPGAIGAFEGSAHTDRERAFAQLDREHIEVTAERVRRAVAERVTKARNAHPDQAQLVDNQANRKRGHLPTRQFFQQAPDVLTALKPCWTMSPLLVSQLLPGDHPYFDVVVFDEASQVTPADAIPALLRARQVVVAGDSRQLPPTAFFATDTTSDRAEGEDDGGDPADGIDGAPSLDLGLTEGYESVLDVVNALFRPGYLTWHYRSRDERLIAFSNTHIYDGMLTTFPGVAARPCVTHELVAGTVADPSVPDANVADEVRRVVDLVIEHARERPDESLGVITMGIKHAERVEEAVRVRVATEPDVADFFRDDDRERFFVKNLERVQGDERDAIILSIGYGKAADGTLPYRFGPLLMKGGERRLNVAITRARSQLVLVSSFSHLDMDPERSAAPGVVLLRAYLEYAASGGGQAAGTGPTGVAATDLDAYERYVLDWLRSAGLPVLAHYGMSGARIDVAVAHPDRPERMVLAIEDDGATYHAGQTARDRDRLRQQVLEGLGWHFHRIWSADFLRDPQRAAQAAADAWRRAVAEVDAADAALAERRHRSPGAPAAETAATAGALTPPPDPAQSPIEPALAAGPEAMAASAAEATPSPIEPAAASDAPGSSAESSAGQSNPAEPSAALPPTSEPTPSPAATPDPGSPPRPSPKPVPGDGRAIGTYSDAQLVALIRWIQSDTRLRTDGELLDEAIAELGFRRHGPRIVERLQLAIKLANPAAL